MTDRDYNQVYILTIVSFLVIVAFIGLISINHLQDQIDSLRERNEILTEQLQEMNRYLQYPGG